MRDKKKTKSGLLTLVVLTLMIFAVTLIFFLAATPSSANDEIQGYICPPGFEKNKVDLPLTPPDRNGNGYICYNGHAVIDDSIIFYDVCVGCHGVPG